MKNILLVSMDGGQSWKPLDVNLPANQNVYSIVEAAEGLFSSLDSGIYRSADKGNSWQLVRSSKDKERFDLVASGKSVYAIKRSAGC